MVCELRGTVFHHSFDSDSAAAGLTCVLWAFLRRTQALMAENFDIPGQIAKQSTYGYGNYGLSFSTELVKETTYNGNDCGPRQLLVKSMHNWSSTQQQYT